MAEVLITLGIIGIVAALTMPSLIQHHRKQEIETRLKKAYNTISNAIRMSELDNGPMKDWPQGMQMNVEEFWAVYLNPYFNGAKVCNTYLDCGYKTSLYGPKWSFANWDPKTDNSRILFQLNDGTVVFMPRNTGKYDDKGEYIPIFVSDLLIDVNGNKLPNEAARDVFYFVRDYNNSRIYAPKGDCSTNRQACTYEIMSNGWKIPDDYPLKL